MEIGRSSLDIIRENTNNPKDNLKNPKNIKNTKNPDKEETTIDVKEFIQVASTLSDKIFTDRIPHTDNFLFFLCSCAEAMSKLRESKDKLNTTSYKRELVRELIPTALDFLVTSGQISQIRRKEIEKGLSNPLETYLKIQNLIDVSNNPNLLNNRWKEEVKCNWCCPCLKFFRS